MEIKRVFLQLMEREEEMLVMAPTGNAANHVQGSTIHTRVSTSTDGSSTRPRTARTAWIGASHCTTWYASRGNQYRTGTSSTLLKVANIVDFD